MIKPNYNDLDEAARKKQEIRQKRKKRNMKVGGQSVKKLQKIIKDKKQ